MESLWIDLFRPAGNGEIQMLDVDQMAPLCEFRNLRVLKITGMMQSYQRYIWKAVWLNPCLEELELGMALSPSIRSDTQTWTEWPVIRGGWTVGSHPQDPVY